MVRAPGLCLALAAIVCVGAARAEDDEARAPTVETTSVPARKATTTATKAALTKAKKATTAPSTTKTAASSTKTGISTTKTAVSTTKTATSTTKTATATTKTGTMTPSQRREPEAAPEPVTEATPLADRRLRLYRRANKKLAPKSLVATSRGHVFAQNMIYFHTVTVFDRDGERLADLKDEVPRAVLGLPDLTPQGPARPGVVPRPQMVRGSPVEAAATADGQILFVSNYALSGAGYVGDAANDDCSMKKVPSFLYEVDVDAAVAGRTDAVRRGFEVGSVPKFLALTPDERTIVVSNWCGHSVSIVDVAGARPTREVKTNTYPRGIAISEDGKEAYVASMGKHTIDVVDLERGEVVRRLKPGRGPRHVLYEHATGALLVTLSNESALVRVDPATGDVLARVRTGRDPRSMALSDDGTAAYIVNYREDSLAVVDLRTMTVVQKVATGPLPIGVAYETSAQRIWVSCYGGSVRLYDTLGRPAHESVRWVDPEEFSRFPTTTRPSRTKTASSAAMVTSSPSLSAPASSLSSSSRSAPSVERGLP